MARFNSGVLNSVAAEDPEPVVLFPYETVEMPLRSRGPYETANSYTVAAAVDLSAPEDEMLFVWVFWRATTTRTVSSVSVGSNSLTQKASVQASNNVGCAAWYKHTPTTGNDQTLTITMSGNCTGISAYVLSVRRLHPTTGSRFGGQQTAAGTTGSVAATTVTPTGTNSLLLTAAAMANIVASPPSGKLSLTAGWTQKSGNTGTDLDDFAASCGEIENSSTSNKTATWTHADGGSRGWAAITIEVIGAPP